MAFHDQISYAENVIKKSLNKLYELAQGGTAVGSGINAPKNFSKKFIKYLKKETGLPFKSAPINMSLLLLTMYSLKFCQVLKF